MRQLYGPKGGTDMKKQLEEVFPQCREVTEQYRSGRNSFLRTQLLLRLAAPML